MGEVLRGHGQGGEGVVQVRLSPGVPFTLNLSKSIFSLLASVRFSTAVAATRHFFL